MIGFFTSNTKNIEQNRYFKDWIIFLYPSMNLILLHYYVSTQIKLKLISILVWSEKYETISIGQREYQKFNNLLGLKNLLGCLLRILNLWYARLLLLLLFLFYCGRVGNYSLKKKASIYCGRILFVTKSSVQFLKMKKCFLSICNEKSFWTWLIFNFNKIRHR